MNLRTAYNYGVKAACARYKVALPVTSPGYGSDYGVGPSGPSMSHGTALNAYPPKSSDNPPTTAPNYNFEADAHGHGRDADALWNISEYDRLAPGYAGEWGQEVIG